MICLKCKAPGHTPRTCRLPKWYDCQQMGHISFDCPEPKKPRKRYDASSKKQSGSCQMPHANSVNVVEEMNVSNADYSLIEGLIEAHVKESDWVKVPAV